MTVDPIVLITILGMAVVTYATRVTGFVLMGRLALTGRLAAWLRFVPGAVLVSIVAPSILPSSIVGLAPGASGVLTGGGADLLAGVVAIVVAARTKNLLLTMVAGVVAVWLFRQILGG